MMQLGQELLAIQRLLILGHLLRQAVLPYTPCGLYERVPFELGDESLDEIKVGFGRPDFKLYVLEDQGKVVLGAVFCGKPVIVSSTSSIA